MKTQKDAFDHRIKVEQQALILPDQKYFTALQILHESNDKKSDPNLKKEPYVHRQIQQAVLFTGSHLYQKRGIQFVAHHMRVYRFLSDFVNDKILINLAGVLWWCSQPSNGVSQESFSRCFDKQDLKISKIVFSLPHLKQSSFKQSEESQKIDIDLFLEKLIFSNPIAIVAYIASEIDNLRAISGSYPKYGEQILEEYGLNTEEMISFYKKLTSTLLGLVSDSEVKRICLLLEAEIEKCGSLAAQS